MFLIMLHRCYFFLFQYLITFSQCSTTPTWLTGSASHPATPAACLTPQQSPQHHHPHCTPCSPRPQPGSTRRPTPAAARIFTEALEAVASALQPLTTREATTVILTRSSLSRRHSSWRRRPESRRSGPTGYPSSASPARERPLTSGSSCSSCCRTRRAARVLSSGPTGRRVSSSWSTLRPSPDSGACTRTSQTWTTRPWAELSGKKIALF